MALDALFLNIYLGKRILLAITIGYFFLLSVAISPSSSLAAKPALIAQSLDNSPSIDNSNNSEPLQSKTYDNGPSIIVVGLGVVASVVVLFGVVVWVMSALREDD
jgi:hypothetical protein